MHRNTGGLKGVGHIGPFRINAKQKPASMLLSTKENPAPVPPGSVADLPCRTGRPGRLTHLRPGRLIYVIASLPNRPVPGSDIYGDAPTLAASDPSVGNEDCNCRLLH